ncbi:MAG: cupredoxin domain-containing protein [Actinomycetota bacterium]
MSRKLLPLALLLALAAAACSAPSHPEVEFGSGQRFVPFVADPLNDAGLHASVAVNADGLPVVSYFAFEEQTDEGELPQARPVSAPTLPGVMATTVSAEGVWSRGALALEAEIPSATVPFNPGFDEAVADLRPGTVTGLQVAVDGDTLHAVWGSAGGLFYATGSADPAAPEQAQVQQVTSTPPVGPSLAVVDGTPWISFSTSTSASASIELAVPDGDRWQVDTIADAAGCDACRTVAIPAGGGLAVAYAHAGGGVSVATNDGENGWVSFDVSGSGGEGLSGTATADGIALAFYDGPSVVVATGSSTGPFEASTAASVAEGTAATEGAGTSIAADEQGTTWIGWADGAGSVGFASGEGSGFTPIGTGAQTDGGTMPSVAVTPDGATAYLAWYDAENQDLLVGAYGEIQGLAIAAPSPPPEGPAQPTGAPPTGECTPVEDGTITITAQNIAFDVGCIEAPAGEPFEIVFDNQDPDQHNVSIYPNADELQDPILQEPPFGGPDTVTYQVPALDAGDYYFQCDVHPTMNGVLQVGGGGGGDGGATGATGATGASGATGETGGDGGGGTLTVSAANLAFDTDTIELPADTAMTLTFDNQDAAVQHNIAIYTDDSLSEELFNGALITGPDTIDYEIPALPAGEYYFVCIVHLTMNGTVLVG